MQSVAESRTAAADARPECWLIELGEMEYGAAAALQRQLVERRLAGTIPDTLLLVEHPPVITLGRRGSWCDILAAPERLEEAGVTVHAASRGGLATYHGPGQLVAYLIARLRGLAPDVPAYVHGLEEAVIRALAEEGVSAWRDPAHPGVWTTGGKIAAIGIALDRGVTAHGLAVNLQPNLAHFQLINPCGLAELGVTSFQQLTGREVDVLAFGRRLAGQIGQVFSRRLLPGPPLADLDRPSAER